MTTRIERKIRRGLGDVLADAILSEPPSLTQSIEAWAEAARAEAQAATEARAVIARELAAARSAAGHTQESLAAAAGVARSVVYRAEAGHPWLCLDSATAILSALDVPPAPPPPPVKCRRNLTRAQLAALRDNPAAPEAERDRARHRLARVRDNP